MITNFNKFKLFENPNAIAVKVDDTPQNIKMNISWDVADALVFSYYFGELFCGKQGEYLTHNQLFYSVQHKFNKTKEELEKYSDISGRGELAGRLFCKYKVLTFWDFPKDKAELKRIVNELEEKTGLSIWNDEWKIEVLKDPEGSPAPSPPRNSMPIWGGWEPINDDNIEYIPIKDYTGSVQRSEEEKKIPHLMTPEEKERYYRLHPEKRIKGWGADLKAKRNPIWWEQAKRTSENKNNK